jgi:catechol 2,3-dioxygenase-like lactoylglutathione lyase family enzyme
MRSLRLPDHAIGELRRLQPLSCAAVRRLIIQVFLANRTASLWPPCEERQQGVQQAQGGENSMFSHIMIGSNDMARSKKFYDALFAAMGAGPGVEDARGRVAYSHNGGRFMLTKPIDGKPATVLNGGTVGFQMKDAAQAEAWHKAGVANGGTSIEDPPGVRPHGAYLAYLRDPDGHKLVGVARPAS